MALTSLTSNIQSYIVLNDPLGHRELDRMSSGSGGPSHPDWFLVEPNQSPGEPGHTEDQQTF